MSPEVQPKREICILDIHSRIEKKDIDDLLKDKYSICDSKIEKKLNVEFKSNQIAKDVASFLSGKSLLFNDKEIKFFLKGNRFIIDGMLEVPFSEIRNFFSTWGDVNNVFHAKKYFATLSSISQAIDLVENVHFVQIGKIRCQIRYALDRNVGFSTNKNFALKNKTTDCKFEVQSGTKLNKKNCDKLTIRLGSSDNNFKKPVVHLGQSKCDLSNQRSNGNSKISLKNLEIDDNSKSHLNATQLNILKKNGNQPLFAKTPPHVKSPPVLSSIDQLNYNSPNFKSTNYLENKNEQVHVTKTYYTKTNSEKPQTSTNQTPLATKPKTPSQTHFIANPGYPKASSSSKPKKDEMCIIC